MNTRRILLLLSMIYVLTACQAGISQPQPLSPTTLDDEFPLTPGQSAIVANTDLTLTFHAVVSDERCPSEVECAVSGPVTVSLSARQGNGDLTEFTLQTYTDENGRSPNVQFEGITNRAEVGDYLIQIAGVTPYPMDLSTTIEPSEYRLNLMILKK